MVYSSTKKKRKKKEEERVAAAQKVQMVSMVLPKKNKKNKQVGRCFAASESSYTRASLRGRVSHDKHRAVAEAAASAAAI